MGKDWIQQTSDWLVEETLRGTRADRVVKRFCDDLAANGIQLARGHVASGQLHPIFRAFSVTWKKDGGIIRDRFSYEGNTETEAWLASPLRAVMRGEKHKIRARLYKDEGLEDYPVLKDFKEQGITDYLCVYKNFSEPAEQALLSMDGCVASFSSDAPEGFTEDCLAIIHRLFPRLAVAIKTIGREQTSHNLASTYLGPQAGEQVLRGRIHRGDFEKISSVIWFSDMRGSTSTADRMDPEVFLNRLNRYFEATAGSVLDHGGEVLRFIGDAVLAIFPISGPGGYERAGRMALAAARDAVKRLDALNENAPDEDPTPIKFGLGLHLGEILFGNIGVPERLEFSVIGAAANEAARLEDLSKPLERTIIASDAFVAVAPADWEAMGSHKLRGVSDAQPVYALVT